MPVVVNPNSATQCDRQTARQTNGLTVKKSGKQAASSWLFNIILARKADKMRRQFVYWRWLCRCRCPRCCCCCCCCRQTCHKLRAANKSPKIFQLHSAAGVGFAGRFAFAAEALPTPPAYVFLQFFLWQSEVCNVSTGSVWLFVWVLLFVRLFVGLLVCVCSVHSAISTLAWHFDFCIERHALYATSFALMGPQWIALIHLSSARRKSWIIDGYWCPIVCLWTEELWRIGVHWLSSS